MKIDVKNNKPLFWVSIAFFLLYSVLFGFQWFKTNENIHKIHDQVQNNFDKMKANKESGPIQIEFESLNKRQVVINPKEIEKINNHINYLSDHVFDESNRTQELIDKDIDRLNLYMSIGIGFMTVLGIFAPILINILSFQDFKDKQKALEEKQEEVEVLIKKIPHKEIDQAIIDSAKAIEDSKAALAKSGKVVELEGSIMKIENDIKLSFPKVSMLTLQNAIVRYFYVAPYLMTNLIRDKDEDSVIELIKSIKNGFDECRKYSSLDDKNLRSTINDFIIYLKEPRSHSLFLNERISDGFFDLSRILESLLKNSDPKLYISIDNKLNEIIESIKKYNAKTEPATQTS